MSVFRFKHFSVRNEKSAMKVNTDGVLLGAAASICPETSRVLDIGTGTGTIALMLAQRLDRMEKSTREGRMSIVGIDVDPDSASEAEENFRNSPWHSHLVVRNISLQDYAAESDLCLKFDLIVSNPPYFENSLKAPDTRRNNARHTDSLSYRDIIDFSAEHLSENGILSMILPSSFEKDLARYAVSSGLNISNILRIRTTPEKETRRIIAEFSAGKNLVFNETSLSIHNSDGKYSSDYEILTKDFLTIF